MLVHGRSRLLTTGRRVEGGWSAIRKLAINGLLGNHSGQLEPPLVLAQRSHFIFHVVQATDL